MHHYRYDFQNICVLNLNRKEKLDMQIQLLDTPNSTSELSFLNELYQRLSFSMELFPLNSHRIIFFVIVSHQTIFGSL